MNNLIIARFVNADTKDNTSATQPNDWIESAGINTQANPVKTIMLFKINVLNKFWTNYFGTAFA